MIRTPLVLVKDSGSLHVILLREKELHSARLLERVPAFNLTLSEVCGLYRVGSILGS